MKLIYDLLKFIDFPCKTQCLLIQAMKRCFLKWELDACKEFWTRMYWIRSKNYHEAELLGTAIWAVDHFGDWPFGRHVGVQQSPIQLPFQQSIIFISPTSTYITILSSIPLPRSLCCYRQYCFHLQLMRQHLLSKKSCMNPASISVK